MNRAAGLSLQHCSVSQTLDCVKDLQPDKALTRRRRLQLGLLLLLLVPLAVGALFSASCGSHGRVDQCYVDNVVRPVFQLAEGIFVSWLTLTSLWLVLGKARISLRILPEILIITAVILTALLCVGVDNPRVWELISAVGLACIWLNVSCLPLRFLGYRFDCLQATQQSGKPASILARGAVSIKDLFLLTTVLAGLVAVIQLAPVGIPPSAELVVELLILVIAVTLSGLAAARFALGEQRLFFRFLTLALAVAVSLTLPLLWTARTRGWIAFVNYEFILWESRLIASTTIVTAMCLFAFRLRGWRMIRTAHATRATACSM